MKKTIVSGIILFLFVLTACKPACDSGVFAANGECCTYVCDLECPVGYEEGTCNCECSAAGGDTNVDDIFDDSGDVAPPELPSI